MLTGSGLWNLQPRAGFPAIYYRREFVEDGGLMSYATNPNDLARRAPFSSTRFSKAPSLPIFPWSSRPSSS